MMELYHDILPQVGNIVESKKKKCSDCTHPSFWAIEGSIANSITVVPLWECKDDWKLESLLLPSTQFITSRKNLNSK